MTCRTVVVDAHHGVHLLLAERTHQVVGTFLHLGVGTLHGIQLDAAGVATRIHRRHTAATQTDAVVVATHHNNLVAFLRSALQAVALGAVTYTTCQHDDLVVTIFLCRVALLLGMLEGEHRTTDEWLTELVAEVTRTVRCLDENLLGSLIEPLSDGQNLFPRTDVALLVRLCPLRITVRLTGCHTIAWVTGHIHRRSCNRP